MQYYCLNSSRITTIKLPSEKVGKGNTLGISLSIAIIPWVFPIYSNYWILLDRNGKHSLPGSGVHVFIGPLGSCCLGGAPLSIVHHDL